MVFDLGQAGKAEATFHARQLANLDLVHVMVTTHQHQPHGAVFHSAVFAQLVGSEHQRLDGGRQWHVEQRGDFFAGALAGRGGLGHGLGGCATRTGGSQSFGLFDIGGVFAVRAIDDGIFARGRNDLEFFGQVAANRSAVGRHGAVAQAKAVEDLAVGIGHDLVAGLGAGRILVEAVGILHDEFAPAHQAKARTALVSELGLDLVEVLGQLLVAAQLLTSHIGDHLFAGGLHDKVSAVSVLDTQQFRAHLAKATCLLPKLGGLHHRHGHLDGARAIHFLAHDSLNLADHPQPHGHVVVNAGPELFNHPGTGHELVADDLGVGRSFLEGGDKKSGGFHIRKRGF